MVTSRRFGLPPGCRGYQPLSVGNFSGQQSQEENPPAMARWRCNLAALSQRFNLYFVACRATLHISMPRDLQQKLPSRSDIVLELPISLEGFILGGHIDMRRPHSINNMRVGLLGKHEILLMACDDGDVLGYYTHVIWNEIKRVVSGTRKSSNTILKPFFHQNVGASAWGLAIHKKSRLLAVSCNKRHVTVFAFACADRCEADTGNSNASTASTIENLDVKGHQQHGNLFPLSDEVLLRSSRASNFKKIITPKDDMGQNIPSIDFVDDVKGNAEALLASDVLGNAWLLSIDDPEKCGLLRPCDSVNTLDTEPVDTGWGVLVLNVTWFRYVSTPYEAFGFRSFDEGSHLGYTAAPDKPYINITETLTSVEKQCHKYPPFGSDVNLSAPSGSSLWSETEMELSESDADWFFRERSLRESQHKLSDDLIRKGAPNHYFGRRALRYFFSSQSYKEFCKALRQTYTDPRSMIRPEHVDIQEMVKNCTDIIRHTATLIALMNLPVEGGLEPDDATLKDHMTQYSKALAAMFYDPETQDDSNARRTSFLLPNHAAILRTYADRVELLPAHDNMPRVFCDTSETPSLATHPHNHDAFERLTMVQAIPELGVVVVGSQLGLVYVLTLTRLPDEFSVFGWVLGLHLEIVLPTAMQQKDGIRPEQPLLGMATAPVQVAESVRRRGGKGPRIWKLVLHYQDHTVLSYDLRRDEGDVLFASRDEDGVYLAL